MTEIPPETIESLGTLEAQRTEDSTTPNASETMGPVAPVAWVNVDPFGRYPSVEISNVELDASFSTNMVATAMGRAAPAAYLIIVIFFTLTQFLESKIYTQKRQFFALNL